MAYSSYVQAMVNRVLNYIGRDATTFQPGSVDNVLSALNDSRSQAQQAYDWQQLRTVGAIYINGSSGAPWATPSGSPAYGPYNTDTLSGSNPSGTALLLKKIDSVWNYVKDTQGNLQPTNRIDFTSEQQFKRNLPTNMGYPFTQVYPTNAPYYYNTIPSQMEFAYVVGSTFYVNTANAATWFMIFAQQKIAALVGSETTDFFIDNYQTWLLFATLQNLNAYVKEDQRVQITQRLLDDAWNKATFDDGQKGAMGEWTNLE